MEYFDKLKAKLETIDDKQFYTYVVGVLGTLLLLILLLSAF